MSKSIHHRIDTQSGLTQFMRDVYHVTAVIPRGCVMTYAQVARAIGRPRAVRAVGTALHRNPFAPAVPCHRVVKSDGSPGGFASGRFKKLKLLRQEGVL